MRRHWLAFATVGLGAIGVAAVAVAELVVWSAQPASDAMESEILGYYGPTSGRIRFGDALWIAGILALVGGAVLIRGRISKTPRRVFLGGLVTCAALLVGSALVAWSLAGDAASGSVGGSDALYRWQLESALFQAGSALLMVPLIAGAFSVDRERSGGAALMAAGIVIAVSLALPLAPWNFFAALAWLVWFETFFATSLTSATLVEEAGAVVRWRTRPAPAS